MAGEKGKGRDRGTGACCESWRGERRGEGGDSGEFGVGAEARGQVSAKTLGGRTVLESQPQV